MTPEFWGSMANTKRRQGQSVRLDDFPVHDLAYLVIWYPYVRRALEHQRSMPDVYSDAPRPTLPKVKSAAEALDALRELEARKELWIRISSNGNLNVDLRMREDPEDDDDAPIYTPVIKVPSLARLEQQLRDHPGQDPLFARKAWRFNLSPDTLVPSSRWQAQREAREFKEMVEPPGDLARERLSAIASILVRELELEEAAAARVALRVDGRLRALVDSYDGMPRHIDEDFEGRASYRVTRAVLDELPGTDRELAKRIGQRVVDAGLTELLPDEPFPKL